MYQRVILSPLTADGEPGPLPPALVGLLRESLADLGAALNPPGEWEGVGYWPVVDVIPEHDPATEGPDGTWDIELRPETSTVARLAVIAPLPPPTAAELVAYAAQRRWEIETGGIVVGGAAIRTDERSQGKIVGAVSLLDKDTSLLAVDWEAMPGEWVSLDRPTMAAIGVAVGLHVQACFSTLRTIHTAIKADPPTITTRAEIDTAFAAAGLIPPA